MHCVPDLFKKPADTSGVDLKGWGLVGWLVGLLSREADRQDDSESTGNNWPRWMTCVPSLEHIGKGGPAHTLTHTCTLTHTTNRYINVMKFKEG